MSRNFLAIVVALLPHPSPGRPRTALRQPRPTRILARQISRLVRQLNDDRAAERDAAEKKLLELAGTTAAETDRFLALLPEDNDQMPLAVRERLTRIRQQVEDRVAKSAVEDTKITLSAKEMPLAEVFAAIEKQTGNRLIDNRQEDAAEPAEPSGKITIELKDEPFWPAIDQNSRSGESGRLQLRRRGALSIVSRGMDDGPRHGRASYAGPFRIEVLEIQAQRNLRQPQRAIAQAATGSRVGAAAAADRAVAASRRLAGHDRHRRSNSPSASRTPCSTSKCQRHAGGRNHAAVRAAAARGQENHVASRQAAGHSCPAGR